MTNKLIIGNLKMNFLYSDLKKYIKKINKIKYKNLVLCPTNIYIPYFINRNFKVGIQNVSSKQNGSYTGEVSATQAESLGVDYVIIGHSERRYNFHESNYSINKKIKSCLNTNLKIILCIDEDIENELNECLYEIDNIDNLIIAFEPLRSIGTDNMLEMNEIETKIKSIKDIINKKYNKNINVLYGGNVNSNNIEELNIKIIDGFLIGRSSLNPEELKKIVKIVNRQN